MLDYLNSLLPNWIPKGISYLFIFFFWITVISLFVFIGLYLLVFSGGISANISDWGQTGDFFGGLFNPLLSILNLLVTVIISLQVKRLTEDQGARQVETQKELLKRQHQFDLIKGLNSEFTSAIEQAYKNIAFDRPRQEAELSIAQLTILYSDFRISGRILFKSFAKDAFNLKWTAHLKEISDWRKSAEQKNFPIVRDIRRSHLEIIEELYAEILA
jgi:uncharacterized membrane protein